jgi:FkbM family methyltransferase
MKDCELVDRVRSAFLGLDVVDRNAALNAADELAEVLLAVRNEGRLVQIPGTPWWVLRDDTRLTRSAMARGDLLVERELAELAEVRALRPGDVVLDVGAFVGDTALIFLERGCHVLAFEPYADAYEAMRRNTEAFAWDVPGPVATLYNVAVGDGRTMAPRGRFGESDGNCGSRMVEADAAGAATLRIDDLNLTRLDFAKIDCEGCEPLVLDGMAETIKRCRPVMLIEAYDDLLAVHGFRRRDLFERLLALGYDYRVAIGDARDPRVDFLCFPRQ